MSLLASTSAANAGHVDWLRACTVYLGSGMKPSVAFGRPQDLSKRVLDPDVGFDVDSMIVFGVAVHGDERLRTPRLHANCTTIFFPTTARRLQGWPVSGPGRLGVALGLWPDAERAMPGSGLFCCGGLVT